MDAESDAAEPRNTIQRRSRGKLRGDRAEGNTSESQQSKTTRRQSQGRHFRVRAKQNHEETEPRETLPSHSKAKPRGDGAKGPTAWEADDPRQAAPALIRVRYSCPYLLNVLRSQGTKRRTRPGGRRRRSPAGICRIRVHQAPGPRGPSAPRILLAAGSPEDSASGLPCTLLAAGSGSFTVRLYYANPLISRPWAGSRAQIGKVSEVGIGPWRVLGRSASDSRLTGIDA